MEEVRLKSGCTKQHFSLNWQMLKSNYITVLTLAIIIYTSFINIFRGIVRNNTWWDTVVFKKIQMMLGGQVRMIMSGSAPIGDSVMDFLRVAFGCQVIIMRWSFDRLEFIIIMNRFMKVMVKLKLLLD